MPNRKDKIALVALSMGILSMLVGLALLFKASYDATLANNTSPTPSAGSMSGAGGITVRPPVQVTPVDAVSLIPKLQKLYTLPATDNTSSLSFLATHDPDMSWAWSPDGKMLATQSGDVVQIRDIATGALTHNLFIEDWHTIWTYVVKWSPDGRTLAVGSADGTVRLYSAAEGTLLLTLSPSQSGKGPLDSGYYSDWYKMGGNGPGAHPPAIAWSPDGRFLASVQQQPVPVEGLADVYDSTLYIWDIATGAVLHRFAISDDQMKKINAGVPIYADQRQGIISHMVAVAWSPDSTMLAALFESQVVAVWDVQNEVILRVLNPNVYWGFDWSPSIQWLPDGRSIIEAPSDRLVKWDAASGQSSSMPNPPPPPLAYSVDRPAPLTPLPTYVYKNEHYQLIDGFSLSPAGDVIATHDGNYVRLWDTASGKQTYKLPVNASQASFGYGSHLFPLAWSPDGKVLAHSNDRIELLDISTRSNLRTLPVDGLWGAESAKWSPDGSMLAILASDVLEVWGDPATHTIPSSPTLVPTAQALCGQWSVVDVPNVGAQDSLRAVASMSDADVWAVGSYRNSPPAPSRGTLAPATPETDTASSLIMHWNGNTWQNITVPKVGDTDNQLTGVAGVSPNDVWAVGYYGDLYYTDYNAPQPSEHGQTYPLLLHWDGKTWTVVPAPGLGKDSGRLLAVTAIASDDVWAVGYIGYYDYSGIAPSSTATTTSSLILHWDGKSWSQLSAPSPGQVRNELYGISALNKDTIWAVGLYTSDDYDPAWEYVGYVRVQPLMLLWNGKTWTWTPAPGQGSAFTGISALSKNSAWAVGPNNLLHWDGKNWSGWPFPTLPSTQQSGDNVPASGDLTSVLALKPNDIWAVGSLDSDTGTTPATLAIHGDGAQWSYVPFGEKDAPAVANNLAALAASPSGKLWAVGSASPTGRDPYSYVLRYDSTNCP